jgi:hypothetical protein
MANELQIIEQPAVIKEINTALKAITKKHKKVSNIPTPKAFIKKKMGMDYVEYSTMRDVADKEYPGWSWTIISSESLGSEAYVVHGRLKWYDCGVWREGDMVAAHRIQKKKGTTEFVDVGNDIKSANTDCIKKALNQYMNICDDVYKNQVDDPELNDDQIETLRQLAIKAQITDKVMGQIKNGEVNNLNFKASKAKLERMTA